MSRLMAMSGLTTVPLISTLCLVGCASAPLHYHSLLGRVDIPAIPTPSRADDLEIRSVRIPAQVDRPEIVVRLNEERFSVLSNEVWLAPLRDEIREALRAEILRRTAAEAGATAGSPSSRAEISVTIERFEGSPAHYAVVAASWTVKSASLPAATLLRCRRESQVPVGEEVGDLVLGFQKALLPIADAIALSSQEVSQATSPGCRAVRSGSSPSEPGGPTAKGTKFPSSGES